MSEQEAQKPTVEKKELTPEELAKKEADKKARQEAAKLEKAAKEAKKKERLEARQAGAKKATGEFVKDPNDPCASKFGDMEIIRSQVDPETRFWIKYHQVKDLTEEIAGQQVRIRARISNSRGKGKMIFVVLREGWASVQAVLFVAEGKVSKGMVDYASKVPKESIVEVVADVVKPDGPIEGCSQQIELQVKEFWCVNKSAPMLPFQIEDASRKVLNQAAEDGKAEGKVEETKDEAKSEEQEQKQAVVKQDAIFRLQSGVCQIYREFMLMNDFVEIHSPKMIGGSSEGGANVFHFKYFDQPGCLAQSPQLYKQMAICGGFPRVFEIGPVFRAENSNTNRHLCEFTGLDMEMEFKNHYFEVLDYIGSMLVFLFKNIKERHAKELSVINDQYPFEDFVCADPVIKINFREGVKMLADAGYKQDELEDLSTETEKALGRIVKEKYNTDFYMLYGYPVSARPFYTMLDPKDNRFTNSYDFFMRGEEITSGAQRIHDPVMLEQRAKDCGLDVNTLGEYINAMKYGAPCHAGAGFGLERIVKFYCNLHNIRKASLFPRDPQRLAP